MPGNVKCSLVQALRLCTGRTAHRGSTGIALLFHRGIALLFHDHGTRRGWGVSAMPRLLLTPGKDPVPIVQEAGWAPGPVWTGVENLTPTRIQSPDRPTSSQLLYQLRYPAHQYACRPIFCLQVFFLHFYHTPPLQQHLFIMTQYIESLSRHYNWVLL